MTESDFILAFCIFNLAANIITAGILLRIYGLVKNI